MADQIVITEKTSQAKDVRAAVGARYGTILPAEGHLIDLQEPEEANPAWKRWTAILLNPEGLYGTRPPAGGQKASPAQWGTVRDFQARIAGAQKHGLEIALDLAFQCTPDHPYVREHPEWFRHRPDGSIQYAENSPKKYQVIYPIDFETEQWAALGEELRSVGRSWLGQGVRSFRGENPPTDP